MTRSIYLDTNAIIAAFEYEGEGSSPIWPVLGAVDSGEFAAVTSEITLAELLPKLIADGETELISTYERLFAGNGAFEALPITMPILISAAHIRAQRMSVKLPDAIHLATAQAAGCCAILTSDRRVAVSDSLPLVALGADTLATLRSIVP